jgi:hypothetical protein
MASPPGRRRPAPPGGWRCGLTRRSPRAALPAGTMKAASRLECAPGSAGRHRAAGVDRCDRHRRTGRGARTVHGDPDDSRAMSESARRPARHLSPGGFQGCGGSGASRATSARASRRCPPPMVVLGDRVVTTGGAALSDRRRVDEAHRDRGCGDVRAPLRGGAGLRTGSPSEPSPIVRRSRPVVIPFRRRSAHPTPRPGR